VESWVNCNIELGQIWICVENSILYEADNLPVVIKDIED